MRDLHILIYTVYLWLGLVGNAPLRQTLCQEEWKFELPEFVWPKALHRSWPATLILLPCCANYSLTTLSPSLLSSGFPSSWIPLFVQALQAFLFPFPFYFSFLCVGFSSHPSYSDKGSLWWKTKGEASSSQESNRERGEWLRRWPSWEGQVERKNFLQIVSFKLSWKLQNEQSSSC